jgi:alpha-2-macroglobulin
MKRIAVALLLLAAFSAHAADKLTILKAGPVGELATLAEANEIRVVFSEPMVVVGKIPKVVVAPWFHVAPAVNGTFRWSGTTTLIFTPDPKTPLPFATKFDVTIDASAKAVSGNTLDKTTTFSFITPTIQLKSTAFYRKGGRFDAPIVIILRFNQPVEAQTIIEHLQLKTKSHEFKQPDTPAATDPQSLAAFNAKVAKAAQAAASDGAPALSFVADDWDKVRYPPSDDQVVIETKPGIPPDTNIQLFLDSELARGPKNVRTGKSQEFLIATAQAQFVDKLTCTAACDPESMNAIILRADVRFKPMLRATSVTDITDPAHEVQLKPETREHSYDVPSQSYGLDELGYSLAPARRYVVRVDASLESEDGQKLGYTYANVVENWNRTAFTSFGDGHGVWESSGGSILPFYARNFRTVKQWMKPVTLDEVVPLMLRFEAEGYDIKPPSAAEGGGATRKLSPAPNKIQSYGIDVLPALKNGSGFVWVTVEDGEPIERAAVHSESRRHSSLVQVTNLGLSVKDSPQNTLAFVTRLDNGAPVAGANVSIRTKDNKVFWSGKTDANGIVVAPRTDLRRVAKKEDIADEEDNWEELDKLHFVVFAEKDGDTGYAASNWHDGITPYTFEDVAFNLEEREPLLRGTIFTDRGVYKPGEEVHIKAVLRSDTPAGMQLLPAGTKADVAITDSHNKEVDKRTITLGEWSSAEWTFKVPDEATLGTYSIAGSIAKQRLAATGEFLVAAYRRPEFRVDVTLSGAPAPSPAIAGTKLDGKVTARYLFGAPVSRRPVKWTYSKTPLWDVPANISDKFDAAGFTFLGYNNAIDRSTTTIESKTQKLDANGELKLSLETDIAAGWPYEYKLEGDVTDISRQHIAGRTPARVEAAPWYVGVKQPPYFADTAKGIDTEIIAAGLDATMVPGVDVSIELHQIQWNAVRRAEGNGFYTWDTERKELTAGKWTVKTQSTPAPLHMPLAGGGEYQLIATATDADGRSTSTRFWFYATGAGYTAWERYDHNRIDLVPEKKTYKPGETARIMIKSPWETATALLTTEREGVRTWKQFPLTSTQQTITVPITETDIPNVFVSVLLVKGRTKESDTHDDSDPGKPSFRLGYTALKVEDSSKRLKVAVKANRDEYRPATKAKIEVDVKDVKGSGARSEVTLWAVDYGVLSLTAYQTPDVLPSVYIEKALQVVNDDSREKIISRRVITPKGAGEGGGGGRDTGPGMLRKDFRVLAFWVGSIVTDNKGHAKTEITLPESLTTYRIMAVAADKQSRFGSGQSEIRINKPLLLSPAFPRFLAVGDAAFFGAVVHSQLASAGKAKVTIKSLDPTILQLPPTDATVDIAPKGSAEVRFNAKGVQVGTARIQMTVSMNGESDAIEDVVPVRVMLSPETAAAYGNVASPTSAAKETLEVPSGIVPGFGGLHLDLSSTAMVGLGEGARYLVDYPYGCAEQRASAALALMLASDLGDAFKLPGIDAAKARNIAQTTVNELPKFQCESGGFAYWAGDCGASPYLTSWVVHVLQRAVKLKYTVDPKVLERAYTYLEKDLAQKRPDNEGWWPAYTAWQAFAVKTLVEGGRNEDSHITRLSAYVDRMPLFAIAYLSDALIARANNVAPPPSAASTKAAEGGGPTLADLHRRLSNGILPEGGTAHVEELADPYLLWFWNSNIRSTAIVLGTLVRGAPTRAAEGGGATQDEELVKRMVRWMMQVRIDGRWGNTQENAWAMESLIDYYRKYEAEMPDFTAVATLGSETIERETFRGRNAEAKARDIGMNDLIRISNGGQALSPVLHEAQLPLTFDKQGTGTLFYALRLRYALPHPEASDKGFTVERHYRLQGSKTDATTFKAGDLISVTLRIRNTKERRFVAIVDPIPAGTEPVESWFATTASDLAEQQAKADAGGYDWTSWWRGGGFDHVERHDDRVNLFATRLGEGPHEFTYLLRATTAGTFNVSPMHAEEMYEPEVFGRTKTETVEVKP